MMNRKAETPLTRTALCLLMVLGALAPLSACTTAPPAGGIPELTFDQVEKIPLNVVKIEIVDNYISPLKAPYAEHLFRQTPEDATKKLIAKQLQAAGYDNALRVIIENAAVIVEDLPPEQGVKALFATETNKVYKGQIVLRFELYNNTAPDIVLGHADLKVMRNKTVPGTATIAERDQAFFDMTEAMTTDLSQGFKTTVRDTFGVK